MARDTLLRVIRKLCLQSGSFTLSSGEKSNYYIDLKNITCTSPWCILLGQELHKQLKPSIKKVVGLELGAIPLITSIATYSFLSYSSLVDGIMMRKKSKGHGTNSHLEGLFEDSEGNLPKEVAIVEDVVTTGESVQFVINKLIEGGFSPIQVIAVVDRSEGVSFNCEFHSLFTLKDVIYAEAKNA